MVVVPPDDAAACVTVTVRPATDKVPVRALVAVFAAMVNVTVPLAVPLAPVATISHGVVEVAAQEQPVAALTVTAPVPAAAATDNVNGDTVTVHGTENMKLFETPLTPDPPGPTAATRDS